MRNAVGEENATRLVKGESLQKVAENTTLSKESPSAEVQQVFTYPNGKTTSAVKKDGKWFLPETGAKNEDGTYKGAFANDAQVKQLNEKFGSADVADVQPRPITKADTKLKKGADFSSDGTYEVTHNGEVIGRMYYDKERKLWSDPEYKPKDAYDIFGNNLGTKEEAIQAMVDRYNSKQPAVESKTSTPTKDKETLEQAVQRVDSTSIIQLDDIIARAEKDLATTKDKAKKEDIQQTINSLTKTRDQLLNTQTTTNKLVNNESIKSESKTSSKGEEGKVGTTVVEEQGKGLGEEVSIQEEVTKESLQTKDPTQKAVENLVADPSTAGDMSQDQAASVLEWISKFGGGVPQLKTKCK